MFSAQNVQDRKSSVKSCLAINGDRLQEEDTMIEIGSLCVKIAGRDARCMCVVVDILDDKFVMIDGQTRRKKCNIKHLEPIGKKLDIKKGASHEEVTSVMKAEGLDARASKPKPKTDRPKKVRKAKEAPSTESAGAPKAELSGKPAPKKPAAPKKKAKATDKK